MKRSLRKSAPRRSRDRSAPLTKHDLYDYFRKTLGLTWSEAREYFVELERLALRELKRNGEFVLPGMVKLVVQKRKARIGRNPATGETIKVPPAAVVKARIDSALRDSIVPKRDLGYASGWRPNGAKKKGAKLDGGGGAGRGSQSRFGGPKTKYYAAVPYEDAFFLGWKYGSEPERNADVVRVHYATDRKPDRLEGHFTAKRSETLSFGWCDIAVPRDHRLPLMPPRRPRPMPESKFRESSH
jgi:DNA-binding protein HU-beta